MFSIGVRCRVCNSLKFHCGGGGGARGGVGGGGARGGVGGGGARGGEGGGIKKGSKR